MQDIFHRLYDGLNGSSEALEALYPETRRPAGVPFAQLYLAQNRKDIATDLKMIYQAATLERADAELRAFADKWRDLYPAVIRSWRKTGHWSFRYSRSSRRSPKPFTRPKERRFW